MSTEPARVALSAPDRLTRIGTIDARFQSYNVEMVEVTGGRFWKPYAGMAESKTERFQYRPPLDLANPRLRKLAAALGPAYVRVSGTWANKTYFADEDPAPGASPPGFESVLTRAQWLGVVDFARAVDGKITTSMPVSMGTRDASGRWTADLARRWFAYNAAIGGEIVAAEFMNEPTSPDLAGAPKDYRASDYARDFQAFRAFARAVAPEMVVLGPGSVGEGPGKEGWINTRQLLQASSPAVDAFSYHFYGACSRRCAGNDWWPETAAEAALSEDWLGRTEATFRYYGGLRDQFEPGTPIWLTETADTVCGGNPWAATFLDSFRYLDQLGRLAKAGVHTVIHNTLAASDYGLLDEKSFAPRPNYWAALLWRRLIGETVYESGIPATAGLHVYAHNRRDRSNGVTWLILNTDRSAARTMTLPVAVERFTLSADDLQGGAIDLNGRTLRLGAADELPSLVGVYCSPGNVVLDPTTITFFATAT